jgi:hypothetical protein
VGGRGGLTPPGDLASQELVASAAGSVISAFGDSQATTQAGPSPNEPPAILAHPVEGGSGHVASGREGYPDQLVAIEASAAIRG